MSTPDATRVASRWMSAAPRLKPGDLQEGDIVRHTAEFLKSTAWFTGVPIDGLVVSVVDHGSMKGWPMVQWSNRRDGDAALMNPFNLEKKKGRAPVPSRYREVAEHLSTLSKEEMVAIVTPAYPGEDVSKWRPGELQDEARKILLVEWK